MTAVENVSLVREQSRPAVYLVVGDLKFWIVDEAEFNALGFRWSKVRTVTDGSLRRFRESRLHAPPGTRPTDVFFDCRATYDAIDGRYYSNCVGSAFLVRKDVLVAGWLHSAPYFNRAPHGLEDVFYNIKFDPVFLDRMYGDYGLSGALVSARWPGNPPAPIPLRLATRPASSGGQPGTPFSSWILPGTAGDGTGLHPELQAWHVHDQPGFGSFTSHWQGRGAAPPHWRPLPEDANSWFPFDPRDPEELGRPLATGDYVILRGALWQDHAHEPGDPWGTGRTLGHDGWSEMHPPDWVHRVAPPGPNVRLTAYTFRLCTPDVSGPELAEERSITPDFNPSAPSRYLRTRTAWGEVDSACTEGASISAYGFGRHDDHVTTRFAVTPTGTTQGRFKGAVFVGWAERDARDEVWVDDAVPAGATVGSDGGDSWTWTAERPYPFVGQLAHRSAAATGMHQHYFWGATQPLVARHGDRLFTMVYLDPERPPDEVMLQLYDGTWEHRAFWGEDLIGWGAPGSGSRWRVGGLPGSGEWVRLEVDATTLGLTTNPITGVAFTCHGGAALWDYTGLWRAPAWQHIGHANGVVALAALDGKLYCATQDNLLWMRDPVTQDIVWTRIGHANGLTAMTGSGGLLWCTTADNVLWARLPRLFDVNWYRVGHANQVVGLTGLQGMLYCATNDNRLWVRRPLIQDINWTAIGHANQVRSMTSTDDRLLCVTQDGLLWQRPPTTVDHEWEAVGWAPTTQVTGLALLDGHLWATTADNRLWRRPL